MALRVPSPPAKDQDTDADQPFYGWRFLRQKGANGRYEYVQVPLTFDDLLNPQEGDHVIHNSDHQRHLHYLRNALEAQVRHDPTAVVLDDVLIDWDVPGLRNHGPDIAVFFGIRERKNWTTFRVADEGVRPTLIFEIVSPATARHDRKTKVQEYHRAGVPLYILVDYVRQRRQQLVQLIGYRWATSGYEPLEPDADGRLWLGPVRLWLGIADNEIVCYDESGKQLGDFAEQVGRTEAAERRASEAEIRLREIEAELRQLRGNG